MGCCSGRCLLIFLCVLQLLATVERQVFDFLGYMWAPIIGNFLQISFVIVGFFGAFQYRPKVVVVYVVWCLVWLGWNIFVICFYLQVGILRRDSSILNIGTGNKSWWLANGIGCSITNTSWMDDQDAGYDARQSPPESAVSGCLIEYYYVEIIHAGVQCVLALLGFCVACYVIYVFTEEDDSSQPVHDELEYIKMRYKSPARCSFRDNKTYETLTTTLASSTCSEPGGHNGAGEPGDQSTFQSTQYSKGPPQHSLTQGQTLVDDDSFVFPVPSIPSPIATNDHVMIRHTHMTDDAPLPPPADMVRNLRELKHAHPVPSVGMTSHSLPSTGFNQIGSEGVPPYHTPAPPKVTHGRRPYSAQYPLGLSDPHHVPPPGGYREDNTDVLPPYSISGQTSGATVI